MISIGMLTAGSDPAGYYLARRAGCAAEYYTGAGERAGVWLGRGAAAAGLAGELDGEGERVLRALLDGRAPDGRVLVAPVLRVDPRGRLPARPLVEAIRAEADRRGLAVEDLLTEATDRAVFAALAAGVDRPRRRAVTVDPARAGRLAAAAGLDPHAVYRIDHATAPAPLTAPRTARTTDRTTSTGTRPRSRTPGGGWTCAGPGSTSPSPPRSRSASCTPSAVPTSRRRCGPRTRPPSARPSRYLESAAGHGLRGHQGDGQRADRIGTAGVDRGGVRAPHLPRR